MKPTTGLPLRSAIALSLLSTVGLAQVTVDGTIGGDSYGAARSVQTVETQFGDNFSELNAAYATIDAGRLYIALTGNLENNFNKLEILIDSKAGGENVFSGTPGNDNSGVMAGLTFDTGFEADYHVILRRGSGKYDVDFAELGTPNFDFYTDVFAGTDAGAGATGTGTNLSPIEIAYDNSNIAGVIGGDQAADQTAALAVMTGTELSIDLADLGSTGSGIRVMAFVNGSNHDFASNQFLGGMPAPQGNLGGDGFGNFTGTLLLDMNNWAGDQFFVVGPTEPGSAYCNADGSTTACPCGNNNDGSSGVAGCAISAGAGCNAAAGGVTLRGSGSTSLGANNAVLSVTGAQSNQPGLFFRADNAVNNGDGIIFGDGLRCAGGNVVRLEVIPSDGSGNATSTASLGAGLVAGSVRRFQYWCRIPGCSPCGSSFTLSNGYEITFTP
jgi:hypothetical protein